MWREVFLVLFCAIFKLFYVSATRCPHGWVEGPMRQKCYLFAQNHLKNWEEARYTCQSMRAELISIEDDTEMSWIKQELRQIQKTSTGGNKEWWMSLQKREVEINDTRWFWQSGVELDNTTVRWGQGEPNNYQQSEFCAEICCPHFLNDINCAQKINYICELDKETSPLTCDADNQWEYYNGTCYKFVQKFKNWKDAVTDCEDLDSALASVSDQLSFHSVATMASFREMDAWLGMYSINEEYFYLNETEAPMVESFMAKKTYRSIKRCLAVNNTITYPTKSLYPDSCRSAKPYICQKPEGICKDGYIQHQSMCYYISGSKMRRAHAETVCLIQKSRLVEIDSASKSSFLVNILKKEEVDEIWIGLKKQGNIWYWGSTGEQPALNRWAVVGQDNNQTMYDCSYMDIRNDGAWNKNYDCDTKLRFVCEIPVVTSFTTEQPSTTSTRPSISTEVPNISTSYLDEYYYVDEFKGYIKLNLNPAPWMKAREHCEAENGNLVTIDSEEKSEAIMSRTSRIPSEKIVSEGGPGFWIGANDLKREGRYVWADDKPLTYLNWGNGQPDSISGKHYGIHVDCVLIAMWTTAKQYGKWYDRGCNHSLPFICEAQIKTTVSTTTATTQTTVPACDLESCNDLYDQAVMLENHSPVMSQAARNFSETLHCISLRTRLQCIYKQSDLCRGHFQYQTQTDGISNQMNRLRCSNKTGAAVFDPITMRKECRMDILGLEYRGTKSTTSTGRTCQSWAKDQPHEHSLHSLYDQQNYCRNPDREPYGPWCYTIDPNQRWEYCDVPYCVGAVTPTTTPTTTTIVTTTTEYKTWSENCGMFWEDSVIPDVCYHFDQTMVDWMTAETACETLGGALISITSLQEQHYISGVIKSSPISSYWIGANSRGSEEGWRWSDGAPFALLHWMPDQPNGADDDEDCASIDTEIGQWEDKTCDVQMGYICKKSEEMSSIVDFAERRYGTEFVAGVGPSGDGIVGSAQSLVSMVSMVDVSRIQPVVSKLVGMVDEAACLPIYHVLSDQLGRVGPGSHQKVCMPLYPDTRTRDAGFDYLPECRKVGLGEEDLLNSSVSRHISAGQVTLGLMMEIYQYVDKYPAQTSKVSKFHSLVCSLFQLSHSKTSETVLYMKVKREVERMKKLKKAKQTSQIEAMKRETFDLPGQSDALVDRLNALDLRVGEVSIPVEVRGMVESLANSFSSVQIEHQKLVTRNQQLEQERVVSLQRETETSIQHEREMTEMKARVEEKNRSLKQARRQRDHWKKMTDKEKAKYEELSRQHVVSQDAEARIQQMSSTIEELQRDKVNLRAQVRYHKGLEGREPNTAVFSRRIDQLKEEVEFWQGQYLECQEQMDAFLNQREVVTFHQGKYIDVIREVYMELMCMRVGAKNVPKIIRTVMEKMTGITPQRLPGTTFAKYMLLEARSVALTHLKEEIQSSAGNLTVGPDGTTKFGHHYGAISLSFSGKTMCMGLRDMACGDAEAYQRLLEGIVTEMTGDDLEQIRQIAVKVKNTVSDQASVNKKFVTLLTEWRERALPHVVENWDTLTVPQKERYININYFFCGLHFLVGLSEQANKTLSLWESLVHPGEKVGAPSLPGGYSKAGESGTTRLVRTVCKAVQDRGCEKAGKPVEFLDYLQTQGQVKEVPLASFKGNRFNILFHNAAGVYYLLDDLLSFAEEHKADNKLFAAVNADVHVLSFQAGVRALGIVSKMVTGPMWRFMEKNGHVSELTPVYQQLYSAFKRLSRDSLSLMRGEEYIFGEEMVQKDDVYNSLVSPSLELDDLTRQILELLFSSFEVVCSRQLKDHIEGGKYAAGWSPELLEESTSVPRTNVGPERIFAQLDSLLRVMPRATTTAIEGITMWTQNHTGSWLASLEEEHREQVLRNAREESREQRQMFVERLAAIRQERQEALATKREKKEAKEQRDRERKEELTQKLQEVGGLWTTADEVDRNVRTLPVGQRVKALQTQVTFRRYVLGTPNTGKILNVMAGGKYLSAERLASNLKCVLRQAQDAREERQQEQQVSGQANPLSDFCLQAEKEKFQQLAEAERQKNAEGPKKKQKTQKGRLPSTQTTAPELTDPEQLIGKRVQHLLEEEDASTKWYEAIVTGLKKRRVAPPKPPKIPPKSPAVGKDQMYGCPEGWISYQTNCYLIARNKTTWTGARSICRKNGGDLVSITDEGEQDYLTSQIPSKMCFNIHSNDSSCKSWAKRGECSNNPVWMARNCHLSCNLCIENCRNLHTSYECDHWASVGECSQNPTYMLKNCALSCGVCDGAIYGGFWIGLNDYKYQMAFEWSDDEDVAFTKWAKGEPNNWNGETHEDCVIMLLKNGLWNDASCSSVQSGFICKKRKQVIDKVTESPLSVGCVNNTIGYDAYCYGINDDPSDWPTAENTCSQATYGHLATINDRHVHLFLASQLVYKSKQFWIGLKQDYDTGLTDTWSSGLPVLYTAWGKSHTGSMDEDGLCVAMTTSHPIGSWVTVNCSSAMGYICEYPREGFTTSTTTTTTEAPQFCPPSFTEYNGYCYIAITNEKLTWMKSRDYCRDLGADLISIHSEEENRWFKNNLFRNYYRNDIWIGLNDRDSEKGFQWSDGSPTDFMSWLPFEPNDIYKYEDCVMTNKYSNGWNDDNCYKPKNFVCKIQKGMPLMKRNITEETEYCDGDKEWIYFEKNCYYISKFYFLRAKEAEEECFKKKSHLLSIHSQSENDFILENIHVKTDAWIGLNTLNIHNLGSFSWSDLTPLDFVQWKKGEPYPTDNKKCVKYQASTGRWFTSNCFKRAAYYICKKKNGTEYIGTPPPLPPLYGGCMPGFIRSTFNNKCYRLYTDEKKTWLEAWKLCSKKGKGYSLLSISNELEQLFISSLLVDVHDKVWIALTDEHSYNKYYWNDGTKLTYTNWHSKEPNGYSEHCGDIFIEPDKFGTWNDERCSVDLNYICQGQQDIGLDIDENTDDCPPGYTAYRNSEKEYSCFKLFTTASDWNTSRSDCLKDGGDLASVRNQAEHSFVRYFLYNKTSSPIWIGLTNANSKDDVTYKWSSAWPLVYTSWNPDKLPSKPCITVDTEFWSDENCETELPYLCKIDSEQPPQPSDNGTCFDGGFVNHDKCFYIFLHNPVSWTEARSLCKSSSLTLASIQNLDQIEFLLNLMKQLAGIKLKIWIGLNKRDKYRYGWSWVDGSNSDFRNWNSGEPSTSFHDSSEDCVEMRPDGTWNDINCDRYEKPYICMSDKVQTTTLPPTTTTIKQTTITKDTVISMETTEKLERTSNKPVIVPNKEQARRKQTQNQTETLTAGQIIGILIGIVGALLIVSCIVFIIHFNKQKGASKTNNRSFVNALYLKTTEEISDDPTRMGSTVKICGTDTL